MINSPMMCDMSVQAIILACNSLRWHSCDMLARLAIDCRSILVPCMHACHTAASDSLQCGAAFYRPDHARNHDQHAGEQQTPTCTCAMTVLPAALCCRQSRMSDVSPAPHSVAQAGMVPALSAAGCRTAHAELTQGMLHRSSRRKVTPSRAACLPSSPRTSQSIVSATMPSRGCPFVSLPHCQTHLSMRWCRPPHSSHQCSEH